MSGSIGDILRDLQSRPAEIDELERDFLELIRKYDVRGKKKNYSQALSDRLARKVASELSDSFPGIVAGETRAGAPAGPVKVDVRLHSRYGMELGISIKTINFRDLATSRFTKNIKRNDKELRAEASDLHQYQPYAVLVGLVLLPEQARNDGRRGISSFRHALDTFRQRVGRTATSGDHELFEKLFVGTYCLDPDRLGELKLHDASLARRRDEPPPICGWEDFLEAVRRAYELRHNIRVRRRGDTEP